MGKPSPCAAFSASSFLGRNEVWYRLPDDAIKHLDHSVVAKYLPNQAQGRPKDKPKPKLKDRPTSPPLDVSAHADHRAVRELNT